MKREIVILTTLCFYLLSFSFATGAAEIVARNEKDKIKLEMDVRDLRSATATEVSAYIDGDMITVETTNHADNPILVEIFDDHDALRAFAGSACNSYNYNCKEIPGCGTFWKYTCDGICKAPTA